MQGEAKVTAVHVLHNYVLNKCTGISTFSCLFTEHLYYNIQQIPDYLAYSSKVLEHTFQFEWESVLLFDREYRKKQAAYGFRWGIDPPHLGRAYLVPRVRNPKHDSRSFKRQENFAHKQMQDKRPNKLTTKNGHEICLSFNSKSGCRWGAACKYAHICAESNCGEAHPQFSHGHK
jgi:hypothetical protein